MANCLEVLTQFTLTHTPLFLLRKLKITMHVTYVDDLAKSLSINVSQVVQLAFLLLIERTNVVLIFTFIMFFGLNIPSLLLNLMYCYRCKKCFSFTFCNIKLRLLVWISVFIQICHLFILLFILFSILTLLRK